MARILTRKGGQLTNVAVLALDDIFVVVDDDDPSGNYGRASLAALLDLIQDNFDIGPFDAMVFKGVIDCSSNPNYPAADRGHTYRVSVAGKIGGGSGPNVEIGDLLICLTDSTAAGTHAAVGASWTISQSNIDGAVVGPASATDNAVARYDATTGKLLQNSAFIVDDTGHVTAFGGNIKFPGSQAASADANTLDDYEEGTFTPVLSFSTPGDLSVTYSVQVASYVKIGKHVHVQFTIATSAFTHTTASGNVRITGLPFTSGVQATISNGRSAALFQGVTKAGYTSLMLNVQDSVTYAEIQASGSGVNVSNVAAADMPTGGNVVFAGSVSYIAAG